MTRRLDQLTADVERGVRDVLARGLADPRVTGLITVTGVRILPDMSRAIIDISILPEDRQELTFHGVSSAASWIRREVADVVRARTLPTFVFRLDTRMKKEAAIIRELERARPQSPASANEPDPESDPDPAADDPSRP
ncbi:MAG: ribosome-binding factor A [Phycisphaerae bacterium]|jgi:ribosome-binding factor A